MSTTANAAETQDQQLTRLQREVETLRNQLRRAQRMATVGTMTAMVAHEFNNILTPIISYAQLARGNPRMTEKAISRAAEGGKKASTICRAILGLTRDDAEPVLVSLAEVVNETLAAMAREPIKDGIELDVDVPGDLVGRLRPVALEQVLLNLLVNARWAVLQRHVPRLITLRAHRSGRQLEISVADNGVGILPENLPRVFDPFFSTKSGREGQEGFGLGLAVCRDIVQEMGGEISVESEIARGTTFTIRLQA
jgi:signal transduction histidine kinase